MKRYQETNRDFIAKYVRYDIGDALEPHPIDDSEFFDERDLLFNYKDLLNLARQIIQNVQDTSATKKQI